MFIFCNYQYAVKCTGCGFSRACLVIELERIFGRSRLEHKELIKPKDTRSFDYALPVLMKDLGGRGVVAL